MRETMAVPTSWRSLVDNDKTKRDNMHSRGQKQDAQLTCTGGTPSTTQSFQSPWIIISNTSQPTEVMIAVLNFSDLKTDWGEDERAIVTQFGAIRQSQ